MVYSLSYRRPAYVSSGQQSIASKPSLSDSLSSGSTLSPAGIPDALSFDRIITGGTCPVSTLGVKRGRGYSQSSLFEHQFTGLVLRT